MHAQKKENFNPYLLPHTKIKEIKNKMRQQPPNRAAYTKPHVTKLRLNFIAVLAFLEVES